jgi:hypothetical protein
MLCDKYGEEHRIKQNVFELTIDLSPQISVEQGVADYFSSKKGVRICPHR